MSFQGESEEQEEEFSQIEEEEKHVPFLMSSSFPDLDESQINNLHVEWGKTSSIALAVNNNLYISCWDQINSLSINKMIQKCSSIYETLHSNLNNLDAIFSQYNENDSKHEFLQKKRTILEAATNDYCISLREVIDSSSSPSEQENILWMNALITWKLASIFYGKKKNSKTEEFLEWANSFKDELKPADYDLSTLNKQENIENSPKYWEFLQECLIRGDYDHFTILLQKHSWKKKVQNKTQKSQAQNEIIDGIIKMMSWKPKFYKQNSQNFIKEDFVKAQNKFLNYINFFISSLDENPSENLENDQNLLCLLHVLKGDSDAIIQISRDDWKNSLSLHFQFSNPLLNRETLKSFIDVLKKRNYEIALYDEVFVEILTNKKANHAIEKMALLFPKYITVFLCDILFEYNALLTEIIEDFEMRTFQEQNIVEFLKYLQGTNLELDIAFPFLLQLRYLDSIRAPDHINKEKLNQTHEVLCSGLILSKFVVEEYGEEKTKEIFNLIDKLELSPELDLKRRIMQRKIQYSKCCEDWESFIYYHINDKTHDLDNLTLTNFFLDQLYADKHFDLELVVRTLSNCNIRRDVAPKLASCMMNLQRVNDLKKFIVVKDMNNMKRGLCILQELLNNKDFSMDYWPLIFRFFLEFTTEKFNEFNFKNFDFINQKIILLDQYLKTNKQKSNLITLIENWKNVKPDLQYRILKMWNKCILPN